MAGASAMARQAPVSEGFVYYPPHHVRSSVQRSSGRAAPHQVPFPRVLPGIAGAGRLGIDAIGPVTTPGSLGEAGFLIRA